MLQLIFPTFYLPFLKHLETTYPSSFEWAWARGLSEPQLGIGLLVRELHTNPIPVCWDFRGNIWICGFHIGNSLGSLSHIQGRASHKSQHRNLRMKNKFSLLSQWVAEGTTLTDMHMYSKKRFYSQCCYWIL